MVYFLERLKFENLVISYKCKTLYVLLYSGRAFENLVISYKCKTEKAVASRGTAV